MHPMRRPSIRALVLPLLLALLVAPVACGGDDKKNQTPTAGPGQTQAATPARPDPKALVNEAADKIEQATSFHFVLEHERGTTPIINGLQMTRAEGDVLKPDRLRADIDALALGGVKVKVTLVSVGSNAKVTNPFPPRDFVALPSGTKVSDVFDPSAGTTAALRGVSNPQITGEETLDGKPVWKVQGDVDAESLSALATLAEKGFVVKGTAWIGKDTKEVYRVRLDGPLGKDDTKDVIRVLTLSRYNDPSIAITPVP